MKVILLILTALLSLCFSCSQGGFGPKRFGHMEVVSAAGPAAVFVNDRRVGTTPVKVPYSQIEQYPMVLSVVSLENGENRQKKELKFDAVLPNKVVVLKYDGVSSEKAVLLDRDSEHVETRVSEPASRGVEKQVVLFGPTLFFSTDRYDVSTGGLEKLEAFAAHMKRYQLPVSIIGYADERADVVYNQRLSLKRARAVFDVLHRLGIPAETMAVEGRGEILPVNGSGESLPWSHARRVEIRIEDTKQSQGSEEAER